MKPLFYALVCFLIAGCAGFNPNGSRNFAIDTYNPLPNEIQIAESRARQYWMQNGARLGPGYLAVDASLIFPDEVQELWPKLINSETTASVFAGARTLRPEVRMPSNACGEVTSWTR